MKYTVLIFGAALSFLALIVPMRLGAQPRYTVKDLGVLGAGNNASGFGINNKVQNKHRISIKEQSIGLASIKERIEMINEQQGGNKASFSIGPGIDQQGTVARICLPYFS